MTSSTSTTSCARCSSPRAHDGGVFNVGTGVETTIAELHRLCERAVGVDAPPAFGPPRAGDARRSVLDPTHASAELGFTASVPLAEGIAATATAP